MFALHAIGYIDIRKTVVIEIKCAAAPRPAGARDGLAEGCLFESAVRPRQVKPVAKGHLTSHGPFFGCAGARQTEMLQPVHRGRIHPDHQKVESAVGIEVRQRVAHAEGVRLGDPLAGHVGEMAVAVVSVKVNAGEIAHDQQVQVAVVVQVNKRSTVNAPTAFLLQPGGHGRVGEIAMPVVQQQIGEMSVVGVVKTGP